MSRIRDTFAELKRSGRGGFIPFITAGDPDLETTELLLVELAAAGADVIELGVPFSDPVADGEVIQRASERALRKGVTLSDALRCVSNAKEHIDVPIVLFSYLNPLLKFGKDRLAEDAKRAGIDAVLITDLIPEEAGAWISSISWPRDRSNLSRRTDYFRRTANADRSAGAVDSFTLFRVQVLLACEMKCHATPNL